MTTKKRDAPESNNKKGGSRAAKKRAKKKQKQLQQAQTASKNGIIQDENNPDEENNNDVEELKNKRMGVEEVPSKSSSMKKKKMQLPMGDDEDDKEDVLIATKESSRPKKKKKVQIQNESDNKAKAENSQKEDELKQTVEISKNEEDDDDDEEEDEERENMILDQFLSHLTPIEILFPEQYQVNKPNEETLTTGSTTENMESEEMMMMMQPDPLEIASNLTTEKRANRLFKSIIAPSGLSTDSFYQHYWEKKPLLISTSENLAEPDSSGAIYGDDLELEKGEELDQYKKRFDGFLSKKDIEKLISDFPMKYGKDLNVTNYCDSGAGEKRRITLDQLPNNLSDGTDEDVEFIDAESNDVWSNFKSGCTIRLLCPQVSFLINQYNEMDYSIF